MNNHQDELFVSRRDVKTIPRNENGDETNHHPNDDHHFAADIDEAIRILQLYTQRGDPLVTLQHYYQKQGHLESLADCWLPPLWFRTGRKKDTKTYWQCTFECPLISLLNDNENEGEKERNGTRRRTGTSAIARPLLSSMIMSNSTIGKEAAKIDTGEDLGEDEGNSGNNNNNHRNPKLRDLRHLSKQWFGDFVFHENDNLVYFGTKKNAQRSAAFCFLWKRFGSQGIPEDQLTTHKNKGKKKKEQFFQPPQLQLQQPALTPTKSDPPPLKVPRPQNIEKKLKKLQKIQWIHALHEVGIRKIHIVYRAKEGNSDQQEADSSSLMSLSSPVLSPTLVVCEMEIRNPIAVQIVSDPMPTKAMARDDAISKILSELPNKTNQREDLLDAGRKDELSDPMTVDAAAIALYKELDEKEQLLLCDPPYLHCQFELPHWAKWNPSQRPENIGAQQMPMILYEVILTKSSSPTISHHPDSTTVAGERLGLSPDQVTRIGVLFPDCEEFCDAANVLKIELLEFEAPFHFRNDDNVYTAKLVRPMKISFLDDDESRLSSRSRNNKHELLESFYAIHTQWKMYGTNCPLDTLKARCRGTKGRHYNFVPLLRRGARIIDDDDDDDDDDSKNIVIDWDLMERVVSNTTSRYFVAMPLYELSLLRSTMIVSMIACSMVHVSGTRLFSVSVSYRYILASGAHGLEIWNQIPAWSLAVAYLSMICLLMWLCPIYDYQRQDCNNRFLRYEMEKNVVFIAADAPTPVEDETMPFKHKSSTSQNSSLRKGRFEIAAHKANKIADLSLEAKNSTDRPKRITSLIPELVHILPMPCDFLFVVGASENYMPSLETAITNHSKAQQLKRVASAIGSEVLANMENSRGVENEAPALTPPVSGHSICPTAQFSFADLLAEATTAFPASRYERLEFLGDRVLNHMISLNIFSRNGKLDWGHDELKDHCTTAKKNVALIDGALRAGVNRLICAGTIPWKEDRATFAIPDSFLCNMAESILGATYLYELDNIGDNDGGQLIVGILERLRPPVPPDVNTETSFEGAWFRHESVCLVEGFDFGVNLQWHERLNEANKAFDSLPSVIKETMYIKSSGLLSKLLVNLPEAERECMEHKLGSRVPRTLLLIALFDANLDGSDAALPNSTDLEGLHVLGMVRDNLFHIGATALELGLSRDFYLLNPNATPSDLHLLLACALTHDVLVYIFLKLGLHKCFFDDNPPGADKVARITFAADSIGYQRWETNGGWTLPGGVATFHKRQQLLLSLKPNLSCASCDVPKYPGIAGGRLLGSDKKLNITTVDDWQFSFKCLVGFLVLSLGTEATWYKLIRPLMEEVMLLTPDEYRFYFREVSTICENYSTGNTNCLRKPVSS